jgi:hypothetical protein
MSCCSPRGYGSIFNAKAVERDARRYRRGGLSGSAGWLRSALIAAGVRGRSVLEVGGGIGSMQIELLEAGAAHATNVEIVDSYEPEAGRLIAEHHLQGRADRRLVDVATDAAAAPEADIVVMHRVICCYPDVEALLTAGCAHARDTLAITFPRDKPWIRAGFTVMNAWLAVRRIAFRGYVHPRSRIMEIAGTCGFDLREGTAGGVWESMILRRSRETAVRSGTG